MANPENKQIPYESTQKDIRDAIESVATAIGGIAIPSADHVSYDNSGSGLSATDVQNALDEIVSDIPTVNNGTLTIQQNGTSIGSFTANSASNVNVNIETPTADKKTATSEFNTADGGLLSKCQINLVPVQSGSGDPYPAGGGKNKMELILSNIKSLNTSGTWSDNEYTINGVKYTILTDDGGNIVGVKATGTASANAVIEVSRNSALTEGESYILNGCPSGGSGSTYRLQYSNNVDASYEDFGNGVTVTEWNHGTYTIRSVRITMFSGYAIPTGGIMFYPMFRLSSVTDPTFAPYSNIRPISGHTEVDLVVKDGDNVTQQTYQVQIGSTVYGGTIDLVSGSGEDAYTNIASYNGETINEPWISSMDVYTEGGTPTTGAQVVYPKTTATAISTTPQQIETLAGQNNLSTPLSGQSIETNGVEYKELFTFADVKEYVDKKIPDAPTTYGTYTLQAVVSSGVPTYSWV